MEYRIRQYTKNSKFSDQLVFPFLELDFNINKDLKIKLDARCDNIYILYNGENGDIIKFENYIGSSLLDKNHPFVNYNFLYFNNEFTNIIEKFSKTEKLIKVSDCLYVEIQEKEVNPFDKSLSLYVETLKANKKYTEYSLYVTTSDKKLLNKYVFVDINNQIDIKNNLLEVANGIIEDKKYFSKFNLFLSDYEIDGKIEYSNPYESFWLKFNNQIFSDVHVETCEIFEFCRTSDEDSLREKEIKCLDLSRNINMEKVYSLIDMPFSKEKFYHSRIKELFYKELDKYF